MSGAKGTANQEEKPMSRTATEGARGVVVDATTGTITDSLIPEAVRLRYLGGSYLATHLWLESSRLEVDPLSAANALVIAPGVLTGFPLVAANRTSLVSKSPQTGLLSESTVGGYFGAKMQATGVHALTVKGAFDVPSYIVIDGDSGTVTVKEAGALWGEDIFRTYALLKELYGDNIDAAVIGPAGENGVHFAAVIFGGVNSRAAGRTGMGAVMGSKNLKAVVVRGGKPPKPADGQGLSQSIREVMVRVRERGIPWGKYGTSGGIISAEATGDLPVDNWRGGTFPGVAKITGQTMAEQGMVVGHYTCWGCPIRCGKDVRLEVGERAGEVSHGPEYETIGAFGSMCMLDDPRYIAAANDLCNRLGMDTISAGSAVAFAMEAYERGIIDDEMAGRPLPWGDGEAILFLLEEIANQRGLGGILAKGTRVAAKHLGPLAEEFAIHVKGLEVPMHDPRTYTSMAVSYATGNRGACHLDGMTFYVESGAYPKDLVDIEADTQNLDNKGKAEIAVKMQNLTGAMNALGLCKFLLKAQVSPAEMARWVECCLGYPYSEHELLEAGERCFNLRRLCNVALGITRKDDTLPPRLLSHPRPSGRAAGSLPFLGEMLHEYYAIRGWDNEGMPTLGTLKRLGLEEYPERLGIKTRVLTK
jgi:aldehyde:ferredoxin oxidoreductase